MKALFIFPPFYSQHSISCGIPQILSYLKTKNHNVKALDLNMKFFNYLYNEKVLNNLLLEAYEIYKNRNKYNLPSKYYNFLEAFFSNKKLVYKIHKTIKNIDNIKQGLKSQKKFNNLRIQQFLLKEVKYIQILINLIFMEESLYKDKEYYINDSKISTYKNFLNLILDDILKENYDYIGFSTSGDTQFLSSLIAAKLLKEKGYKGKIGLGGSDIFRKLKIIKEDKLLFKKYIDIAMLGPGEYAHEEYFEFLNGKRELKDVCNIIHLDNNENIIVNEEKYLPINNYHIPCYDDYDFSEYIHPEPILPIRASYACYWGKCVFCAYYYNDRNGLFIRKVDDLIEEIKIYIEKYNVNTFLFADHALPPKYLDEFATKILEQKIEIYFFMQSRLDDGFDKTLLKKLYKAGLRICGWGLESASQKLLEKMNKGININSALKILKTAHSIGIQNFVYMIKGFPGETDYDFELSYNFIKKNIKLMRNLRVAYFNLDTASYMYSHPEEFGINKELIKQAEAKLEYNDSLRGDVIGYKLSRTQEEKINEIEKRCNEYNKMPIGTLESILLYSKYNTNFLNNIKFMIQSICKN